MGSADFKLVRPVPITGTGSFSRASPKWVFDKTGTLVEVPVDTLAVTYDPSDLSKAPYALIEPEATNLLESTDRLEAVKWRFVESDYVVEKGATDADTPRSGLMRVTKNSTQHKLTQTVSGQPKTAQYTASVEARAEGINRFRLQLNAYGNQSFTAVFNLNTGTYSLTGEGSVSGKFEKAAIQETQDGWYRCELTGWPSLSDSGDMFDMDVFLLNDAGVSTFVGDGVSGIRFRRWQLEKGDKATSFIPRPTSFNGRAAPKQYFDSSGVLQTAAANVPAYTHDPVTGEYLGMSLEYNATNYIRNNTMQGVEAGVPGVLPTNWTAPTNQFAGLSREIVGSGVESGIEYVDIRYSGVITYSGTSWIYPEYADRSPASVGQVWALSMFVKLLSEVNPTERGFELQLDEWDATNRLPGETRSGTMQFSTAPLSAHRFTVTKTLAQSGTTRVLGGLRFGFNASEIGQYKDFPLRIGLPQLQRDRVDSLIKTSGAAVTRWLDLVSSPPVTRAADVVGTTPGLVYSNVPITEPLWVAGTYAKGATVRDAAFLVYESLVDGNTAALTDKTKWLPLGATNQRKMFDKAVNSQTTSPDLLAVMVKPGELVNSLTLLNVSGSSVTVSQSESGYSRTRSLVTHDVLSWYDFFYQEPLWVGDVAFDDIPPYSTSPLVVIVNAPGNQAAIGGFFAGKAKFIGTTQWGLTAGVLSYSSPTTDTFGNTTLQKRDNAKKMNFEVAIPRGYEDEAYRYLRTVTDVELVAIASTNWAMTLSYGYLGQWDVPLAIDGRKASFEWRGLI